MKKIFFLTTLLLTFIIFTGCGDSEEMERLQRENDSLKNTSNESNQKVDEYMLAFNEIQANLNEIKQKEKIIDLNAVNSTEITPAAKEQINNDIKSIYELMQENQQALANLKQKIKNSGVKNQELEKTIALYEQQMIQKDEEISALKQKLESLNFNMEELNKEIAQMKNAIDTMKQVQNNQNQVINEQDKALNTVFYAIGTKEELKKNGVVSKDGILSKLSLDPNFNKSYFTEIDLRNVTEIPINNKKMEIMTQHPNNSYTVVESDGKITKLKITDKEKFWSLSKFLVIMLK